MCSLFLFASGVFGRNSRVKNGIVNKNIRPYSGKINVKPSEIKNTMGIIIALRNDETCV